MSDVGAAGGDAPAGDDDGGRALGSASGSVRPAVPRAPLATRDDLARLLLAGTPLIDVRAPVEFARGAAPGAVNLPLLDDAERHAVGVRYKARGQDAAIALGAELLDDEERARRVARWRAFAEARPEAAIYCFRGGLRSRIAQRWLAEAGVTLPLVEGGYKALRRHLIDALERLAATLPLALVGGRTGVGKTALVRRLGRAVDLEDIARHRGSSFGAVPGGQPGNVDFENRVTLALARLESDAPAASAAGGAATPVPVSAPAPAAAPADDPFGDPARIWLEDEARLIGRVCMPGVLVEAMRRAPIVVLEAPLERRVANCLADYVDELLARYRARLGEEAGFDAFAAHHRAALGRVRKRLGGVRHREASALLESALAAHREHGERAGYVPFVELMLARYYDPMYDYQLGGKRERVRFAGDAETILARHAARA